MKPTTEKIFLKFMATVSKAIGDEGEITPEDITPEILDNQDFRQRIRLYGHTVEEVEQLIADGKCYRSKGSGAIVTHDEDALYVCEDTSDPIIYPYDHIEDEYIEYILIAWDEIERGLLLKKIEEFDDGTRIFSDVLDTFRITVDNRGIISSSIGYDSF